MSRTIGIDLGATNNCMAVMEGRRPTVITSAEGVRTTPSIVVLTETGGRLISEPVKRQAVTSADRTISPIKRHMDTDYRVDTDGKEYTPQEIPIMILQKLKADVESYLGEIVAKTIITVSAYFNNAQRQVIKDAGRIADLDVKRIINEPTTAALAYGLDNGKEQEIMVYDLDGSTFDVSIVEIGDGVIEVLSTNGDTRLGDDDFDNAITNQMVPEFKRAEGANLSNDKMILQRLKGAIERTKKELSTAVTTNINPPFTTVTAEGPKHLGINLTGAKFDELTHDLVERTIIPVQSALKDAGITAFELGKVPLVGDSTRMITVQEKVKQLTGKESSKTPNPNECVAIDTAIQGSKLASNIDAGDILLLDVTPLSLSIETMGDMATRLIGRNTTILAKKSQVFSAAVGNQTAVDIHVVQGGRQSARDDKTLGQFRLDGIPPARRGVPQIEATFDIDTNGTVNISAKGLGTGKEQHITTTSGSNMSSDDVDRAVKEAAEYKAQNKKRKETIDVRGDAGSMVFQTEKILEEAGDKIVPGDKAEVKVDFNSLKEAINRAPVEGVTDAQAEDIKTGREKLMNSIQKLFTRTYEQAQASGTAGQADPDMDGAGNVAGDGNVVDTNFKEAQIQGSKMSPGNKPG